MHSLLYSQHPPVGLWRRIRAHLPIYLCEVSYHKLPSNCYPLQLVFPPLLDPSRSVITIPWLELGGVCAITCRQSGYTANVEFHTKVRLNLTDREGGHLVLLMQPFYGGKKHWITAEAW